MKRSKHFERGSSDSHKSDENLMKDLAENDPRFRHSYISFMIEIQDFGCGISEQGKKNLFINFNNLEEHQKKNQSGRGLGLSICKLIVEKMGGTVKIKSKEGKGSTFSVQFKTMCKIPRVASGLLESEII
jgi:signal transduction histidine kinase